MRTVRRDRFFEPKKYDRYENFRELNKFEYQLAIFIGRNIHSSLNLFEHVCPIALQSGISYARVLQDVPNNLNGLRALITNKMFDTDQSAFD